MKAAKDLSSLLGAEGVERNNQYYRDHEQGMTVIPSSYKDSEGGRPDMNSANGIITIPLQTIGQSTTISAESESPSPQNSAKKKTAATKRSVVATQPVLPPVVVREETTSSGTPFPKYADRPMQVTMVGDFGKFKTRPADVIADDNLITLVFSTTVGDDDLHFEPPIGSDFTLVILLSDGSNAEHKVKHCGVSVEIPTVCIKTVSFAKLSADN